MIVVMMVDVVNDGWLCRIARRHGCRRLGRRCAITSGHLRRGNGRCAGNRQSSNQNRELHCSLPFLTTGRLDRLGKREMRTSYYRLNRHTLVNLSNDVPLPNIS